MTMNDLTQWIKSQVGSIRQGDREKARDMALAERTWNATVRGTLDDLKKGCNLKKVEAFQVGGGISANECLSAEI